MKKILSEDEMNFIVSNMVFFHELNKEEQNRLLEIIVKKNYKKGTVLSGYDTQCAGLLLLSQGQIRTYMLSESGKELTLYRLFPKEICIFSASCMMKTITYEVMIEVEKETEVFSIPIKLLRGFEDTMPAVRHCTMEVLNIRFSAIMEAMEKALFQSVDKRIASFLIEQMKIEGNSKIFITQERIAGNLGTAREVVTRILKSFERDGAIYVFRGGVEVIDKNKLEKGFK